MSSIVDVVRDLRAADLPLTYLSKDQNVAFGKFLEFEIGEWSGRVGVVPTEAINLPGKPGGRSFMYRGQNTRHPSCIAALLRETPSDEMQVKARLAFERFRVAELELILKHHPFKQVADRTGFMIDYHALAQHYGIPTSLLDLTSNVEVAAFFAGARWDGEKNRFLPMESGVGVIYRLDWSAFGPGYSKYFNPVGIGPGLRPARQHAWTFKLRPGADFLHVPHLTEIEFEHDKSASEEIFAQFDSGAWLYPPDCLASLVEKVRDLPFVTMNAIRYAAEMDGQPADAVERAAEGAARLIEHYLDIEILDGHELWLEETDLAVAETQAKALEDNIRDLRRGFRLVRTLSS